MGTFTNCTIHGYQLGKWGSDGGTLKFILVNGHINGIPTQGGGWDVTYSVRANVGSGDIATFGEGDVSLSSIEDVLFIDISSGNEVNHDYRLQTGSPAIDAGDPNDNYVLSHHLTEEGLTLERMETLLMHK